MERVQLSVGRVRNDSENLVIKLSLRLLAVGWFEREFRTCVPHVVLTFT